MNQIFLFAACLFGVLLGAELLLGRHKGIYSATDWKVNISSFLIGLGMMRPLTSVVVAVVIAFLFPTSRGALSDWPLIPAFIGISLIAEFAFYWVHRFSHEGAGKYPRLSGLWKFHRTHHSGKYMNVLTNFRQNLGWLCIQPEAWIFGLSIYLGLGAAAGLAGGVRLVWNVVTHCNFRWDDPIRRHRIAGPVLRGLEHVFVTPGLHHTHHGWGRDGANYRNYGTVFSIFDTMFGTLLIPQGRPARYGLPGPQAHWLEEIFYPLIRKKTR
ncbi:sterol desaturase family protein [Sphingobium estronivorans]|uniref:sterol desaturase family protein n=1 Tax=Sphingobium estronivorans TaxID=1577690 RepID=UPI001F07EEDA|nr:sterol desaturase family protein [Sphingobium estronivorans]